MFVMILNDREVKFSNANLATLDLVHRGMPPGERHAAMLALNNGGTYQWNGITVMRAQQNPNPVLSPTAIYARNIIRPIVWAIGGYVIITEFLRSVS